MNQIQNDLQHKQESLFYNFIKNSFEIRNVSISEKVILALSNDIEFKVHEIAKLARNIMLKAKRNYSKSEDISSALNLTFNNLLLVNFEMHKTCEKTTEFMGNKINLSVFSNSLPTSYYKVDELSSIDKRVYTKLMKSLFDRDDETYMYVLSLIREKLCLNNIFLIMLSTILDKIDRIPSEEFYIRIIMMLESIIQNKSAQISENPMRDLIISLAIKLLMCVKTFNFKLKISAVLKNIISCQYLLQHTIGKMVVNKLFHEFNQPFLNDCDYSGCLIGIASLDNSELILSENFLASISSLPDSIKDTYSMKEAACYLVHKMRGEEFFSNLSYDRFQSLLDNFFIYDSLIQYVGATCCVVMPELIDFHVRSPEIVRKDSSVSIKSYNSLTREIDLLLHGSTADDLVSSNFEIDDMPPILFRKSSIQPSLAISKYTCEDMGFLTQPLTKYNRRINFRINAIEDESLEQNDISKIGLYSEFYNVFQRCHQFIVNSKTVSLSKTTESGYDSKTKTSNCVRYCLLYSL